MTGPLFWVRAGPVIHPMLKRDKYLRKKKKRRGEGEREGEEELVRFLQPTNEQKKQKKNDPLNDSNHTSCEFSLNGPIF